MSTLHTINSSPASGHLESCLRVAVPGDGILFLEDGIYALVRPAQKGVEGVKLYALSEDLKARGLSDAISGDVELIDYEGFVELTCRYPKSVSWF